jgi:hypothetical protein
MGVLPMPTCLLVFLVGLRFACPTLLDFVPPYLIAPTSALGFRDIIFGFIAFQPELADLLQGLVFGFRQQPPHKQGAQ